MATHALDTGPMRKQALATAVEAARSAGALMRRHFASTKKIQSQTQHDIKLELDVRCQRLIERRLVQSWPDMAIFGEEGVCGEADARYRWVVDPIDGTVNFTYGIPHACVSIALQQRCTPAEARRLQQVEHDGYYTLLGVVYDPFCDELWTAQRGQPTRLNGRPVRVSQRRRLAEAIVALGFSKNRHTLDKMLPLFGQLVHRVRKLRIMGAAALSLAYVAGGRMDAYTEYGVRLWDIAAGGLMVECAGGDFWHRPVDDQHTYQIIANNGRLRRAVQRLVP